MRTLAATVAASVWFAVGPAVITRADTRCEAAAHPVHVRFHGDGWTGEQRERIMAELAGALVPQGFAPCLERAQNAVAEIQLRADAPSQIMVSIEVHDEITEKRLSRDVSLAGLPPDSRPLAIAVASDELLRASWLELAMTEGPEEEPVAAPPVEVHRVVEDTLGPPNYRWTEIGTAVRHRVVCGG